MDRIYIANQALTPQMDELRWLVTQFSLGENVSLGGEKGNGKSTAVRYAAEIIGKPVFARNCFTTEQPIHYVGTPNLEQGNSGYSETELRKALMKGGILLNEEASEMPMHIQKFLSTLLTEDRPDFIMPDNKGNDVQLRTWKEQEGWKFEDFIYAETYNPAKNASGKDNTADSHGSRMGASYHFSDIDSLVSAYVALNRIGKSLSLPLETRGIAKQEDQYVFCVQKDGKWVDMAGNAVKKVDFEYQFLDADALKDRADDLKDELKGIDNFYFDILLYLTNVRGLASNMGEIQSEVFVKDSLADELRSYNTSDKPLDLRIIRPDQRTIQNAFRNYNRYRESGFDEVNARQAATKGAIENMCYGARGKRMINGQTQRGYLSTLAREAELLERDPDANDL